MTVAGVIMSLATNMTEKKFLTVLEDDPYEIIASPRAVCSREG